MFITIIPDTLSTGALSTDIHHIITTITSMLAYQISMINTKFSDFQSYCTYLRTGYEGPTDNLLGYLLTKHVEIQNHTIEICAKGSPAHPLNVRLWSCECLSFDGVLLYLVYFCLLGSVLIILFAPHIKAIGDATWSATTGITHFVWQGSISLVRNLWTFIKSAFIYAQRDLEWPSRGLVTEEDEDDVCGNGGEAEANDENVCEKEQQVNAINGDLETF